MDSAPLHNDLAEGPEGGQAYWLRTADGVRIRAAYWPGNGRGTVFVLPGRTEYVEKYGRAAADLVARGYSAILIDWRGQGMADRAGDPMIGHIDNFSQFQTDLDAVRDMAEKLNAPKPWYMIAHSMGGCIGLRALHNRFPVESAVFSGPMWGLKTSLPQRAVGWTVSSMVAATGLFRYTRVLGTSSGSYVLTDPFEDNVLTSDLDMWQYMRRQTEEIEGAALAGPSLQWLFAALVETRRLQRLPAPPYQAITFLGTNESVVDTAPIHRIMDKWPNGRLVLCEGCEHEIIIERPEVRKDFFDQAEALFSA